MIGNARKSDGLAFAHPVLKQWFLEHVGEPTLAQARAWPAIARGESVLLLAPTGSGKTLAAFLVALDRVLFRPREASGTRVLYISPLKALGVDIERNLEQPLSGLQRAARRAGVSVQGVKVAVRSGDTSERVRAQLLKNPADILITTPESLYLMLISRARETLRNVETVIVDEIHAVSGTKRGAHLFLSLERLQELCSVDRPLQRIGLSATQRPLEEVARLLGGASEMEDGKHAFRPVTIVDVGKTKSFELRVELPTENRSDAEGDTTSFSIWPSMYPRLVELIRAHRTTMIFVNNRRLAERLAAAINELAGEELTLAHHGSIAKDRRAMIEHQLKQGELRAVIATSSLELGIDIGSVDLVVQVEAPASVASGVQRIGRAGHQVGEVSRGVLLPKFRGDLLACASIIEHIKQGHVEQTFYPRNPLDVLAQQIVAHVATGPIDSVALYALVRCAAPFFDLPRKSFDGVLEMLCGRYPSERFRQLRARLIWDRNSDQITARRGARLLAIGNGGAIVDRGLFGVYVTGSEPARRIGELDEEMVFESRAGDVFLLGASSWRVDQITHERVWVSPAPGEPGRMPFWRGERPGRSLEFGLAIGSLTRTLASLPEQQALERLETEHALDRNAASHLVRYLAEQSSASFLPTDEQCVIECVTDEVGDYRVIVLTPFGGRVHTPWAMAVVGRLRLELGRQVDSTVSDDGMVFRIAAQETPPELAWFLPEPQSARRSIESELFGTSLFAAHFRENAARSLLLPRRQPGRRTPFWVQNRRARDLLSVARDFVDFPVVLETYRECFRDVFDLEGLLDILRRISEGRLVVKFVMLNKPSPFAASLLFSYVANFLYDNNAPPAERRVQALELDHDQLRGLLGEPELRELLDAEVIEAVERRLQRLDRDRALVDSEDLYDLLWELGDSSLEEILRRSGGESSDPMDASDIECWLTELEARGRAVSIELCGEQRWVIAEDVVRYRDGLGLSVAVDLPAVLLHPVASPLADIVLRFSRTRGPYPLSRLLERYGLERALALEQLRALEEQGQLVRGEFLPQGSGEEWCHTEVLARIKQQSLARARKEVRPVSKEAYARFLLDWHHIAEPLRDLDGLLTVIEELQAILLPWKDLERSILPLRVQDYQARDVDELCTAGEVVWRGAGSETEPKLQLFLTDEFQRLAFPPERVAGDLAERIRSEFANRGALFFTDLVRQLGAFSGEVFKVLWQMVWAGEVTCDTLAPLRSLFAPRKKVGGRNYRSRRSTEPGTEGRWTLLPVLDASARTPTSTERANSIARNLLLRYGVLSRDALRSESIPGGFASVYPVLRAMEEAGRVRRGYFVDGLSGAQFTRRGADVQLRAARHPRSDERAYVLSASDPANPFGVTLPWPDTETGRCQRSAGSHVVLHAGRLLAYVGKRQSQWLVWLEPLDSDQLTSSAEHRAFLDAVIVWFRRSVDRAWLIETINGSAASESAWRELFQSIGFEAGPKGLQKRRGLDHDS